MSIELPKPSTADPRSSSGRGPGRKLWGVAFVVLLGLGAFAAVDGRRLWSKSAPTYAVVLVEKGDLPVVVVEGGSIQSANNETVKCQVEALTGLVGGQNSGQGGSRGGSGGGGGAGGASGAAGGAATSTPASTPTGSAGGGGGGASGASSARASATGKAASGGSGAASSGSAGAGGGSGGGSGGSGGGSGSGGGGSGGGSGGTTPTRPSIKSFTMNVAKYTPAKTTRTTTNQGAAARNKSASQQQGQGQGGNNNNGQQQEKAGSTRIIKLLPEGMPVKAGEVICVLDSSAFRDEVAAQKIRYFQANANVEQVKSQLFVNEISLREYRDGVLPKDREVIDQYTAACQTNLDQSQLTYDWSLNAVKIGLLSDVQARADMFDLERAKIAIREARGMKERLDKYTAPRLIIALEAKLAAIRADVLAQEVVLEMEKNRLTKLQKMVDNCTITAPRDGIVVYVAQNNGWGQVTNRVEEGATVREGQPLINLPDPTKMCVQVKANESKVTQIHVGQGATIRVDAFPDRVLRGHVTDVRAIGATTNGPFSDVRVYDVQVAIEEGNFDRLRPGLSSEVSFDLDLRRDVTLVPIRAIREVDGASYAAVVNGETFAWRPVEVGAGNPQFFEVRSGLKPGDAVVADPSALPPPRKAG